eukprot:TRINITY_DN13457_c0_g1_i16.p1 TRINITY_DN13457_c0_g1~~TRINITY_DN13457_c0_g1_i16.p1  ORF type:complete len:221 (+),score=26.81 TRINITY_DN13457_c0_g1_i16:76-738(+)
MCIRDRYCRINTFLIGVLMAWMYIAHKQAKKESADAGNEREVYGKSAINQFNYSVIHNWYLRYSMYVVGLVITSVCVYTYFDFFKVDTSKSLLEHHFFTVFFRPGFIIGMALVIYPACLGKARILRAILGYHIFNVLSKATYAIYMLHLVVLEPMLSMRDEAFHFNEYVLWLTTIDGFLLSCAVALVATLVFEYPIIGLSKEFLRPKRAPIISDKETGGK